MTHAIDRIELQCAACKQWTNSPIQFKDTETFYRYTLSGNKFDCPHCGALSPCNKENVRFTRADGKGGWVGVDVKP